MFLVSRTSSSDSSLFPEDLSSGPEDSNSTVKPARLHSRRLRPRPSGSGSQSGQSSDSLPGHGKPGEPSQPKLVEMLKGVSEVLEENTRLKKKRLEREIRKSRLNTRVPQKPYDIAPGKRVSNVSDKTSRRVPGASGKISKGKGKEVIKIVIEDSMDVDLSVTLGDVSMNENSLPESVDIQFKPPPSDSQSSAKRMPPPPVPSKALKQPPKQKSSSRPTPSPPPPSSTQTNQPRRRTLGMTRSTTQTSPVPRSILPANRKPFKSPLLKQEPGLSQSGGPPRSQSKVYPIPTSSTPSQPIYPTQKPTPTKSSLTSPKPKESDPPEVIEITDDPDTSYDFSASSIDGEEFNKAMAEYDRGSW